MVDTDRHNESIFSPQISVNGCLLERGETDKTETYVETAKEKELVWQASHISL